MITKQINIFTDTNFHAEKIFMMKSINSKRSIKMLIIVRKSMIKSSVQTRSRFFIMFQKYVVRMKSRQKI